MLSLKSCTFVSYFKVPCCRLYRSSLLIGMRAVEVRQCLSVTISNSAKDNDFKFGDGSVVQNLSCNLPAKNSNIEKSKTYHLK